MELENFISLFFRKNYLLIIFCLLLPSLSFAEPVADTKFFEMTPYSTGISPSLSELIGQKIQQKKYQDVLSILDAEIKKDPNNITLLYQEAAVHIDLEQWRNAEESLKKILSLQSEHTKANKLLTMVEAKRTAEPHNEIGFDQDEAYVSVLNAYWTYASLHYYRYADWGNIGGRINYANRYGGATQQPQLEAYPRLTKNFYATLIYAYARNSQILFPTRLYRAEGFYSLPTGFEISLGNQSQIYNNLGSQHIYDYTGSIGKYLGNYFFSFRPSFFTPLSTRFYELALQRYFSDKYTYIAFKVGFGRLPDIGNLPPLDQQIIIRQKGLTLNGQWHLTPTLLFRIGAGYIRQIFPSGNLREITDGSLGITLLF